MWAVMRYKESTLPGVMYTYLSDGFVYSWMQLHSSK